MAVVADRSRAIEVAHEDTDTPESSGAASGPWYIPGTNLGGIARAVEV